MADFLEKLAEMGFTPNESKIYLSLLEMGPSPAGDILKATKLYRVITYDVLQKLIEKGFVSYFIKNNKRQFMAEDPEKILATIRAKEKAAEILVEQLHRIGPRELPKKQVMVYEKFSGIKSAQENYFKAMEEVKDEYLMFGASLLLHEKLDVFFNYFHGERAKRGIKARLLFNEDNRAYGNLKKKYPPVEIRYMPPGVITPSWISMYSDMMLIGVIDEEPFAFFIKNKSVVESYRRYFELLWKLGKK